MYVGEEYDSSDMSAVEDNSVGMDFNFILTSKRQMMSLIRSVVEEMMSRGQMQFKGGFQVKDRGQLQVWKHAQHPQEESTRSPSSSTSSSYRGFTVSSDSSQNGDKCDANVKAKKRDKQQKASSGKNPLNKKPRRQREEKVVDLTSLDREGELSQKEQVEAGSIVDRLFIPEAFSTILAKAIKDLNLATTVSDNGDKEKELAQQSVEFLFPQAPSRAMEASFPKVLKSLKWTEQDVPPTVPRMILSSEDATEQIIEECEIMWKQMEECQNKLTLQEIETLPNSDPKLLLLMKRMKALAAEFNQWQNRTPEIISSNPDVLVALGKEQLQRLDQDLEMVLSTVLAKKKKLKQDLQREQQWLKEQQQIIDCLNKTEEEISNQFIHFSEQRSFQELQSKMLKIKAYKEKTLNALGDFLEDHFPLPENDGSAIKKLHSSKKADVQLVTLHEILKSLIDKFIKTPHEPYVTVSDSFWSPYIELLLRYGIVLRHPEDPKRIRLENFHQ